MKSRVRRAELRESLTVGKRERAGFAKVRTRVGFVQSLDVGLDLDFPSKDSGSYLQKKFVLRLFDYKIPIGL